MQVSRLKRDRNLEWKLKVVHSMWIPPLPWQLACGCLPPLAVLHGRGIAE